MKVTRWAMFKIALIVFFTIAVVAYRVGSVEDAWALGLGVAICLGFIALFQPVVWFFYDMMTLKRGGWAAPSFGRSPFASPCGPFFHLEIEASALITFGVAKIVSAIVQGWPSIVLGAWLLVIGALLLVWQKLLRRLFRPRFAGRGDEPGGAASRSQPGRSEANSTSAAAGSGR